MLVSTAMVNGFTSEISEKIFGFWGHIHVKSFGSNESFEDSPMKIEEEMLHQIKSNDFVRSLNIYAHKAGIIKTKTDIEGIILKGLGTDYDWSFFNSYLIEGGVLNLNDSIVSREVMISKVTANRLKLKIDDYLIIYFLKKNSNDPIGRKFKVKGIYNTGLEEYDKNFILGDISMIRSLNKWNKDEVGGIEVNVKNIAKIEDNEQTLYYSSLGNNHYSETIYEIYPNIFEWLALQRSNEKIILSLMILVAIFNMVSTLLILILDRTNMIGILKSMGAPNAQIRKIFLYNAAYIIIGGMIIGNLISFVIIFTQQQFGIIQLPEDAYYVSTAPIKVNWLYFMLINLGTIISCLLALLLPSYLIQKIDPIKTIRYN